MGVLSDLFGQSDAFYVRDFRNAYHLRPDVNPPRQKFQGYVNFVLNREIFELLYPGANGQTPDNTEFRTKISSLVRKFSLPEIDFKTEVKNQYNRKRIVNTGVEYTPVNITVMDTVGNEWYTLLMRYYAFHYMNARNKNDSNNRDLTTGMPQSQDQYQNSFFGKNSPGTFDSNAYGLNVNTVPNFFERVDMILYHGNKGVQYSLMNPVLTALKTGDIDYADSNVLEFDLTFEYENFVPYYENNFGLTAFDLNRFENAGGYTGDAFTTDGKPDLTLANLPMAALGTKSEPASRSDYRQIYSTPTESKKAPQGSSVSTDGQVTDSQGGANPVNSPASGAVQSAGSADNKATAVAAGAAGITFPYSNPASGVKYSGRTGLKGIYGDAATFSNQADLTKSSLWGEIFKSTINKGLVTAINGGSVQDAVINTLVSGVVAQGDAWALNLRGASTTPATSSTTAPTRPAPPPPATSNGATEPVPVIPGPPQ